MQLPPRTLLERFNLPLHHRFTLLQFRLQHPRMPQLLLRLWLQTHQRPLLCMPPPLLLLPPPATDQMPPLRTLLPSVRWVSWDV